ncbi:MAG: glycosyl hydrolase [bacterium]|nr:glycosyl hydrolase [bacterium]
MKTLVFAFVTSWIGTSLATVRLWPEPTPEARPWAYNWWMGSAVDEAGLRLQVEEMTKVGMGGFHVIPIYSVKNNPQDRVMLSPDWMKAFGTAVRLAGEKGLGVDLTMGSGWCFGGPQLRPEDGSWMIELNSKRLEQSTVLWKGEKGGKPVVLSVRRTGQKVKRSGPGGHGPMMNPLSPQAIARFLEPYTAAFDAPGAPKPGHLYHDSYEYFQAGWSWELLDAFEKRRGYRLQDHYAEFAGVGTPDAVARVKCDYRETVSEMIVEDVFPQWTDWCRARGIQTRNEAHGASANWLDFYAIADIPETEMFSCDKPRAQEPSITAAFMNSGDRDILVSKFASSAAHVKHLGAARDPLVSAESCTWICEHFCETLGAVKTFVDRLFLSGVNHMFYHGMCYSPADAKWPGWTFYATCEMNRFNPIWRDVDLLNAYITRVQSVAQEGAVDNDILVYWPLHDYWMDAEGFERQLTVHARGWLDEQPVGRIARRLLEEGYMFDFISEKQLLALPKTKSSYTTIVVPGAKAMKPTTLARLAALSDRYTILFVDGFPTTVPGFKDVASREGALRTEIARLRELPGVKAGAYEELMAQAPVRREPFNRANGLASTRHAQDGCVTYFIANQWQDDGVKGRFKPASPCRSAFLRNPLTGEGREIPVEEGTIELDLPIGQSVILTVRPFEVAQTAIPAAPDLRETRKLDGPWTRTPIAGGPEFPAAVTGTLPLPWGRADMFPESAFCGTMRYETAFELPEAQKDLTIDLGQVNQSAKVYVNGIYAGGAIFAPYRVRIPRHLLKVGENRLAVEVTSTGANRLRWLDTAKPYEWKVFTDINVVDIDYKKFNAASWSQRKYGLFGPVRLFEPDAGLCEERNGKDD